jgi:hypothetical protein
MLDYEKEPIDYTEDKPKPSVWQSIKFFLKGKKSDSANDNETLDRPQAKQKKAKDIDKPKRGIFSIIKNVFVSLGKSLILILKTIKGIIFCKTNKPQKEKSLNYLHQPPTKQLVDSESEPAETPQEQSPAVSKASYKHEKNPVLKQLFADLEKYALTLKDLQQMYFTKLLNIKNTSASEKFRDNNYIRRLAGYMSNAQIFGIDNSKVEDYKNSATFYSEYLFLSHLFDLGLGDQIVEMIKTTKNNDYVSEGLTIIFRDYCKKNKLRFSEEMSKVREYYG